MPFFPVDDDFSFHAKARAAGNAAIGLWTRAGAYCMKQATDGILERHELAGLGTLGEAKRLVASTLWHEHGHDCPRCAQPPRKGWVFHDWFDIGRYKSGEELKRDREEAKERMRRKRAEEKRSREQAANVPTNQARTWDDGSGSPSPHPSPSVVQVVSQSPTAPSGATGLTDEEIERIRVRLGASSATHARKVADAILTRADAVVLRPFRYVLKAIDAEPDRYRPTPGPNRKADECPDHPGQPASNCGGHRADAIAGDA